MLIGSPTRHADHGIADLVSKDLLDVLLATVVFANAITEHPTMLCTPGCVNQTTRLMKVRLN